MLICKSFAFLGIFFSFWPIDFRHHSTCDFPVHWQVINGFFSFISCRWNQSLSKTSINTSLSGPWLPSLKSIMCLLVKLHLNFNNVDVQFSGLAKWRYQNGLTLLRLLSLRSWHLLMKIGSLFAWHLWPGTSTSGLPLESRRLRESMEVKTFRDRYLVFCADSYNYFRTQEQRREAITFLRQLRLSRA